MSNFSVSVNVPSKLGDPTSKSKSKIGGQAHGVTVDTWEQVSLSGKPAFAKQDVSKNGQCYFVKDLSIRVDFALEYFIAEELQNFIDDAVNDRPRRRFWEALLRRIKRHAESHYKQYVEVIEAWRKDILSDLSNKLPTEKRPTSSSQIAHESPHFQMTP
jgi:hypothetical protein